MTLPDAPTLPVDRHPLHWPSLLLTAGIFSILSVWMAIASPGFLEADGMTHYLSRRFAIEQPTHFVSVWNRPFCVLLYCLPSKFTGLIGTRVMSLVLVLAMTAITLGVAQRLPLRRPTLAALLLLTQPLLFAHSFAELTEVPFALLLISMFWAYQRRCFWLLAALAALGPLARPEGFGVLLLVAGALVLHRRWYFLLILPVALIAWSALGWHLYGRPSDYPWWRWLPENWPYSAESVYGHGSAFRFVAILPAVVGPIAFGFLWFGLGRLIGRLRSRAGGIHPLRRLLADHEVRCTALVAIIPLGVLLAHSFLWAMGKMASNGEPRYMLVVAPFWALLAAIGLDWLIDRLPIRRPGWLIALAAAVPIAVNLSYPAFPLGIQDDDRLAAKVVTWLDEHPELRQQYPWLSAALPHLYLQLDIDKLDKSNVVESSQTTVRNPPAGVLMIWSTDYSTHNSDAHFTITEDLLLEHGWRPIDRLSVNTREAAIYLSPQPAQ